MTIDLKYETICSSIPSYKALYEGMLGSVVWCGRGVMAWCRVRKTSRLFAQFYLQNQQVSR